MTEIVDKALKIAAEAHSGAMRKGSNTPYVLHVMEAAVVVSTITDDQEVIAAALLHDVLEDTDYPKEEIRRQMGDRVMRIISDESEDKRPGIPKADSWKVRKEEMLTHLREKGTWEDKVVAMGDKLSNMRSIRNDYRRIGNELWNRFNMKDPEMHHWYYESFLDIFSELKDTPAYREYESLIREVWG